MTRNASPLRLIAIAVLGVASLVGAPPITTGAWAMPPAELVEAAILASPAVEAARAEIDRAEATAKRLRVGEYEVQLTGGGGRRDIEGDIGGLSEFTEWQAGLTRPVRLPGKRRADRNLADIEVDIAEAAFDLARRDAALRFVNVWSAWRAAAAAEEFARDFADDAGALAAAETKSVAAGGARRVYADQLGAEASLADLQATQARIAAADARAALAAAFPDLTLPERPARMAFERARLQALIAADPIEDPAVRVARLDVERQQLRARRSRLDRAPDPQLGVQVSNEFGGRETSFLATVSIPLTGRARAATAAEAQSRAVAGAAALRASELAATNLYESALRAARASMATLEGAEKAADAARRAMDRMEEGRRMDAVTLTDLINARRTFQSTMLALSEQRTAAERALLTLAVLKDRFGPELAAR